MPGERTPWNVPMMPDADIVALSGSVSNHWSRKSAALIVMSWTKAVCWRSGSRWKSRSRPASGRSVPRVAAGRIGRHDAEDRLDERAISTMSWPYSSYASASDSDQRRSSRIVWPWSFDAPQVIASASCRTFARPERRERAVERQDVETVLRQLELADDLGPQQRDDVAQRR